MGICTHNTDSTVSYVQELSTSQCAENVQANIKLNSEIREISTKYQNSTVTVNIYRVYPEP